MSMLGVSLFKLDKGKMASTLLEIVFKYLNRVSIRDLHAKIINSHYACKILLSNERNKTKKINFYYFDILFKNRLK